ncbi:MAG: SUMF1/EgtB/PvdO family nonheme iron enzyme [Acidobacteriota bacterium]|nr:SUMF1/EgtB/PvdO family nonheme iron enzyme [Acidobacteriota bacterium]
MVRRLFLIVGALATAAPRLEAPVLFEAYAETIPGSEVRFERVPVPAGLFVMGTPAKEKRRRDDEGPQREVEISAYWMGRREVSWDEYRIFMSSLDLAAGIDELPEGVDAVARPTPPYVPMDFGMGVGGYPAIAMTQFAARQYTRWLSKMTGHFYRLPTEAEWEYACRADTSGATYLEGKVRRLGPHAWYEEVSDAATHRVGELTANPWGLLDMLGNVAEWTLDEHRSYPPGAASDPIAWPTGEWNRVTRGGSFRDGTEEIRCGARRASRAAWKRRDPQFPKSIWFLTDAPFVGLRVVRPRLVPPPEDQERYWAPDVDSIAAILDEQRAR